MHVSTARFHLDQLEEAGLVSRQAQRNGQRGRPHMLYAPGAALREAESRKQLTHALVEVLARDADGGVQKALDAGHSWAQNAVINHFEGASYDEVHKLIVAMERLGFGPEADSEDNEIVLHACPLRGIGLGANNLVCTVHLGLLQGTVEGLGHDANEVSLTPYATPDTCLIRLRGQLAQKGAR